MADRLTREYFAERVGQVFGVALAGAGLELELIEVKGLGEVSAGESVADKQARRESFSLVFRGPADTPLGQGMFDLGQSGAETLDAIFLVPIAADQQGRYYEAIFN